MVLDFIQGEIKNGQHETERAKRGGNEMIPENGLNGVLCRWHCTLIASISESVYLRKEHSVSNL